MTTTLPTLDPALIQWLETHAQGLDEGIAPPAALLPALGRAGVFAVGVPQSMKGSGGSIADAILNVASIATHSLTAAFVTWGHRTFIEYLLHSPNAALREQWLPSLLDGSHAGATGLSNAMKYLGGIESLQIHAADTEHGLVVNGKLPWVTNLRPEGFLVAAVAERGSGKDPVILAIAHDAPGVVRSADLDLIAMRSSNTAAVDLVDVPLDRAAIIDEDALRFLAHVRPAFLGLQCGLSIGLTRRCLNEARQAANVLGSEIDEIEQRLATATRRLVEGVSARTFRTHAAPLFELRIELAELASGAASLEIQATGGRGYLHSQQRAVANATSTRGDTFPHEIGAARRWRETAFIPIVTPSLTQLKAQLARHRAGTAA